MHGLRKVIIGALRFIKQFIGRHSRIAESLGFRLLLRTIIARLAILASYFCTKLVR